MRIPLSKVAEICKEFSTKAKQPLRLIVECSPLLILIVEYTPHASDGSYGNLEIKSGSVTVNIQWVTIDSVDSQVRRVLKIWEGG